MNARIPLKLSIEHKERLLNGEFLFKEGQNVMKKYLKRQYQIKHTGYQPGETGGSI